MLDYEWGNPSTIMISGDEPTHDSDPTRQIFDHYSQAFSDTPFNPNGFGYHHNPQPQDPTHHTQTAPYHSLYDPRAYGGASYQHPSPAMLSLESMGGGLASAAYQTGFMVVPKAEPDYTTRIGLNLGGRTYFSSSEDDFVNRLYRRTRPMEAAGSMNSSPRCQAEGCQADLTHAKHYHRRHKVCEFHSKAATVIVAGLTQRFCQQCSRFHLLTEFDNGKRSCRKRLADHNRRRRKSTQQPPVDHIHNHNKPKLHNVVRNPDNLQKSPEDSGAHSSSVTIAVSPPRMTLDCFKPRSYQDVSTTTTTNSNSVASTSSLFYCNGR